MSCYLFLWSWTIATSWATLWNFLNRRQAECLRKAATATICRFSGAPFLSSWSWVMSILVGKKLDCYCRTKMKLPQDSSNHQDLSGAPFCHHEAGQWAHHLKLPTSPWFLICEGRLWTHWRKYLRWRPMSDCDNYGKRLDSLFSPSKHSLLILHWVSPPIQIVGDIRKNNHSFPGETLNLFLLRFLGVRHWAFLYAKSLTKSHRAPNVQQEAHCIRSFLSSP